MNNDAIQNEMENVVANVEPSFIEKIVNNENVWEFIDNGARVGGWLTIGYVGYKGIRYHLIPLCEKGITALKEKFGSKEQTNPIDELKEVVEAEVVA